MPNAARLFHNWRLKLSALGLSIFLWGVVQAEPSNRETFSAVPVRVEIADTSWILAGAADPPAVEVRLGGVAREIIRLAREGTAVRVPVSAVGSTDTVVTLRREWVDAARRPGVTVESLTPSVVRLSFEPAVTRLTPVAIRTRGALAEGSELAGDIAPNPSFVRVRGPVTRMRGLDSIALQPLDLSTVSESGTFTVAVDTSGLAGGSVTPATVALGLRVEEVVERVLGGVVVRAESAPGQPELVFDPAEVQVRISGVRSLVTALDPAAIQILLAPELLQGMAAGEVRRVPVRVGGVPDRVRAEAVQDIVTVRRAADVRAASTPRTAG